MTLKKSLTAAALIAASMSPMVMLTASPAQAAAVSSFTSADSATTAPVYDHIWSPSAPAYQKIPDNAPKDPASASKIAAAWQWIQDRQNAGKASIYMNTGQSDTMPLVTSSNADPIYDIIVDGGDAYSNSIKAAALKGVRIPVGAKPSQNQNGDLCLSVYNKDTKRYVELWGARFINGQWHAWSGGSIDDASKSNGTFPHPELGEYVSASGMAYSPYIIKAAELKAGRIDHIVSMAVPPSFINGLLSTPATGHDSFAEGVPDNGKNFSEGQILKIPASVDLTKLNLPPVAMTIAKAAQEYGIIVMDGNGVKEWTDADGVKHYDEWSNFGFAVENSINMASDPYPSIMGDYADWNVLTGAYGSKDWFPFDKLQVLARNYVPAPSSTGTTPTNPAPTVTITTAADATTFGFYASSMPAGSMMKVKFLRDGQWQYWDNAAGQVYSGTQIGWSQASATIVDSNGKVIASTPVLNPPTTTTPAPSAAITFGTHAEKNYFGFKASSIPAGGKLTVKYFRDGQWQIGTQTTPDTWSGYQVGWSQAQATVTDSAGKVVGTSPILNPPVSTNSYSIKVNGNSASTFGFTASAIPYRGKMVINWTRGAGAVQTATTTSKTWTSGTQNQYTNAKASILDSTGKVVATSNTVSFNK